MSESFYETYTTNPIEFKINNHASTYCTWDKPNKRYICSNQEMMNRDGTTTPTVKSAAISTFIHNLNGFFRTSDTIILTNLKKYLVKSKVHEKLVDQIMDYFKEKNISNAVENFFDGIEFVLETIDENKTHIRTYKSKLVIENVQIINEMEVNANMYIELTMISDEIKEQQNPPIGGRRKTNRKNTKKINTQKKQKKSRKTYKKRKN